MYHLHSAVLSPIFTLCSVYNLHSAVLSPIFTLCSVYNLHSAVLSPIFTPCNVYCLHSAVLSPIFTPCSVYHLVIYTVQFSLPSLHCAVFIIYTVQFSLPSFSPCPPESRRITLPSIFHKSSSPMPSNASFSVTPFSAFPFILALSCKQKQQGTSTPRVTRRTSLPAGRK